MDIHDSVRTFLGGDNYTNKIKGLGQDYGGGMSPVVTVLVYSCRLKNLGSPCLFMTQQFKY